MTKRVAGVLLALFLVVAAAGCEPMPESGRFSTPQYRADQITAAMNLQYGTAVNLRGQTVVLRLDLYLPPDEGPGLRPLVVAVHGGGFTSGDRSSMASAAVSYARLGYVAATISYRLEPGLNPADPPTYFAGVFNAIDDGMESVRWLRSRAGQYAIDPNRVAMVGSSAGGAIALGVGVLDDPTPTGPVAAYSPKIHAAVSTGAPLTPGIDAGLVTADPADAPAMLFHYDVDTVTGFTFAYASEHCAMLAEQSVDCRMVRTGTSGHTVSLDATGSRWFDHHGPFLWAKLRLWEID